MTEPRTATDEQRAIVSLASGSAENILVRSLAGTGKTSTIEMIEAEKPAAPILYLAFARKNVAEAKEKMTQPTTVIKTINGIGHGIWGGACGHRQMKPDGRKVSDLVNSFIYSVKNREDKEILWSVKWDIVEAVKMAKAVGYVPEGKWQMAKRTITQSEFHSRLSERPDDLVADVTDEILHRSIAAAYKGLIDWDDQVYMPAVFGGPAPQFPLVIVDEAQDQNPAGHLLISRLAKRRLICVGDDAQNIYGFRGAHPAGMNHFKSAFGMTELSLTQSFRCPEEVVKHVHWHVPDFRWAKQGGSVEHPKALGVSEIPDDSAIICRNNAPLFRAALHLLGAGRSVSVAGSDIGPKLIGIMEKLGEASLSRDRTIAAIDAWLEAKLEKESKTAQDLADCMKVFANVADSLGQAISYAEYVLKQEGALALTTGHKAKGMEWDTVFHLDPWLCRDDEPQDRNLRYVISTRSANRLVEIDSKRINW